MNLLGAFVSLIDARFVRRFLVDRSFFPLHESLWVWASFGLFTPFDRHKMRLILITVLLLATQQVIHLNDDRNLQK